ncbi:MAG: NAD(P)/FAD-dependent oxidoreductase [Cyanobacteria bacterium P01_F01_bin.33]
MKRGRPLHAIVIGGGAAGFFGAIACARANPRSRVVVLEATRNVLTKVLISGGGRCNVTHACFEAAQLIQSYPRGSKALRGPFSRFQPRDTVAWFAERGVQLKTEADGRMFPTTDDSATVADCLVRTARKVGVHLRTRAAVATVTRADARFHLQLKSGETETCDRLLLATGSNRTGYAIARSLGHVMQSPVPSLFTFTIRDRALTALAGTSAAAVEVTLQADRTQLKQTGPLLVTHWGVSGPAVLKLSAWGARILHDCRYQADLRVNWLPHWNGEQVRQEVLGMVAAHPKKSVGSGWLSHDRRAVANLPRRLWKYLVVKAGLDPASRWNEVSKKQIHRLVTTLTCSQWEIAGKGAFKEEFVTCGGVDLSEVQMKTLASRICPGLYFAGEILDIDGVTGGFNFQNAWTTGWLAGRAMAEVEDERVLAAPSNATCSSSPGIRAGKPSN